MACAVIRYLVPPRGTGFAGVVAALGHRFPLPFGVALFFLFSAMVRYWGSWLLAGRSASVVFPRLAAAERDGERLARRAVDAEPALLERRRRDGLTTLVIGIGAALAALFIHAHVVEPYRVLGPSMLPTLEADDRIASNKLAYGIGYAPGPHRGDIVVFRSSAVALGPAGVDAPDVLVKRVVGLSGDQIEMRGGQPIINGWPVPSCDAGDYLYLAPGPDGGPVHGRLRVEFLDDRTYLTVLSPTPAFQGPYVVLPGQVFVLGDNRGNSVDSRAWNEGHGGGVPVGAVEGRAQWFLVGTHRSGDADLRRFAEPIDRLQIHLRLEAIETTAIQEGITQCLRHPPRDTRPPPPNAAPAR
jgi:signal peptidase I